MYIRIFMYTKTKEEAKNVCDSIFYNIETCMEKKEIIQLEPYWKITGVYKVEVEITLKNKILERDLFEKFLKSISNKWISYGNPIDEILISNNLDNTFLVDKRIEMINIFFDAENIKFDMEEK